MKYYRDFYVYSASKQALTLGEKRLSRSSGFVVSKRRPLPLGSLGVVSSVIYTEDNDPPYHHTARADISAMGVSITYLVLWFVST